MFMMPATKSAAARRVRKADLPAGAQELIEEAQSLVQQAAALWTEAKAKAQELSERSYEIDEEYAALLAEAGMDAAAAPDLWADMPPEASDFLQTLGS